MFIRYLVRYPIAIAASILLSAYTVVKIVYFGIFLDRKDEEHVNKVFNDIMKSAAVRLIMLFSWAEQGW